MNPINNGLLIAITRVGNLQEWWAAEQFPPSPSGLRVSSSTVLDNKPRRSPSPVAASPPCEAKALLRGGGFVLEHHKASSKQKLRGYSDRVCPHMLGLLLFVSLFIPWWTPYRRGVGVLASFPRRNVGVLPGICNVGVLLLTFGSGSFGQMAAWFRCAVIAADASQLKGVWPGSNLHRFPV